MIEIHNILEVENYIDYLDAVIFDLDDTLYSEKQYVKSGYRKIAEYFGIFEMENEMWEKFQKCGKVIDEVLDVHGLLDQKDEAIHIYRFQEPEINVYHGVNEMINHIKKNKKIGIITDGRPEGQRAKIKALGLEVDYIVITDELGGIEFRKPNPRSFELMIKKLEVSPERTCYIGDNLKKDFVAPQMLGMRCIWFNNPDGLYLGNGVWNWSTDGSGIL
jgi:putative hydrolase of the HAD superfamily